ncbi:MAG TPA: peptidylprolyl isomerase [Pyrinomonadaceae bacterium]|nr:peptidylprolyl isomerase [Pyrinomonadaceae bacterium]
MDSTKKALVAAAVAIVFAAGLIFWQVKARKTGPVELTAEDMTLIAEEQPPQFRQRLATDENFRKEFAQDVRRLLAVAEEASAHGVDKDPEMKRQLEFQRATVIAQSYFEEQGESNPDISDKEVEEHFKVAENQARFDQIINDAKAKDPSFAAQMQPEQLEMLKQRFGRIYVAEKRAVEKGIDKKPAVRLQLMLQRARAVAQKYAMDNLQQKMKASDAEIDAYLASHPEADVDKVNRAKAEEVLKRLRAGEDFAKMAAEFGSDGTKDKGGDLGWFGPSDMDPDFSKAAYALKPGQISEVVQTKFGFHIIKLEDRKTETNKEGKSEEKLHARHILISDPNNNPFGPPQTSREKARMAVEQEKAKKVLDEIVSRSHVKVADNYQVKAPEQQPMQGLPPGLTQPPVQEAPAQTSPAKPAASPANPH